MLWCLKDENVWVFSSSVYNNKKSLGISAIQWLVYFLGIYVAISCNLLSKSFSEFKEVSGDLGMKCQKVLQFLVAGPIPTSAHYYFLWHVDALIPALLLWLYFSFCIVKWPESAVF